jgi:UDP-glucuronate 4-epimerase
MSPSGLLQRGETVIGVDDFNAYYDPSLKDLRAARLEVHPAFRMVRGDIAEPDLIAGIVRAEGVRRVVHLAAQAGVRYSLENPFAYQRSNLAGHLAVLDAVTPRSSIWSTPRRAPSMATDR